MPIALIPAGEDIPEATPEVIPVKRGRGRPPGALNKKKPETVAPPLEPTVPEPTALETPVPEPPVPEPPVPVAPSETESESESEEEAPPPPKRRHPPKAKPKAKPKPKAKATRQREDPIQPDPETPRTAERRHRAAHRDAQAAALNHRKDQFAVILDRFMR
jgi:hypothetical protein